MMNMKKMKYCWPLNNKKGEKGTTCACALRER